MAQFDVVIIGCGAIGSAVGRELCCLHKKCLIVEKKVDILDEASSGNTGHLARQVSPHYIYSVCAFLMTSGEGVLSGIRLQLISNLGKTL